jgi:hypothetical protein
MASVIMKRDGFYGHRSKKNKETGEWEEHNSLIDTRGENSLTFLKFWNKPLTIEEGVLAGDLFRILHQMDPALLTMVELLTDSNWKENLKEAFLPVEEGKKDEAELKFVEVYRLLEITNYTDLENFELSDDYTCTHGIGKVWDGPEMVDVPEEEKKDCNAWAIEFTPWNELRNVPLRIRPKLTFSEMVWVQGKRRKMISNGGDEDWNFSDKDLDREKMRRIELDYTMTLGEFMDGLANELCFFGDPDSRREEQAELQGRLDEVKETLKNEKN